MVSKLSLFDNKSPQISRTLLSIMADLSNAVGWMVTTGPLISMFFSPFTNPLVTRPNKPITITVVFFQFYAVVRRNDIVKYLAGFPYSGWL